MNRIAKPLTLLILTLWAGAAIMFAAVVAPTIFNPSVMGDRELSASITGAILKRFFTVSHYAFGITLILSLLGWLSDPKHRTRMRLLFFLSAVMFGITLIQDKVIRTQMVRIQLEMKNTTNDAEIRQLKEDFDRRHRISTSLYGLCTATVLLAVAFASFEGTQPAAGAGRKKK